MLTAKRIRIRGKVQGVSFRESMRAEATRLGLVGWVRNRRDQSVEAWAQGSTESLAQLAEWAHRGPPRAEVKLVEIEDLPADPALRGFERRETM